MLKKCIIKKHQKIEKKTLCIMKSNDQKYHDARFLRNNLADVLKKILNCITVVSLQM